MPGKGVQAGPQSPVRVAAARWDSPHRRSPSFTRLVRHCLVAAATLGMLMPLGCRSLRRTNEAIVRVESKRNPARAKRLTLAGIAALHKHEIDHAADQFRKAIEADFTYGPAHNNLGLLHYEQGNLYQAAIAFEQAREFLPGDAAVLYNLGLALESAGQTAEAMDLYYQANAIEPANPNYLGNLVRLRLRMGETDDLLRQQLQELVLIETRPEWQRWADRQLALTLNVALDRGPATPDFQTAANRATEAERPNDPNRLRDKIIDLTPVTQASHQQDDGVPENPASDNGENDLDLSAPQVKRVTPPSPEGAPSVLLERDKEELSLDDYFRTSP